MSCSVIDWYQEAETVGKEKLVCLSHAHACPQTCTHCHWSESSDRYKTMQCKNETKAETVRSIICRVESHSPKFWRLPVWKHWEASEDFLFFHFFFSCAKQSKIYFFSFEVRHSKHNIHLFLCWEICHTWHWAAVTGGLCIISPPIIDCIQCTVTHSHKWEEDEESSY